MTQPDINNTPFSVSQLASKYCRMMRVFLVLQDTPETRSHEAGPAPRLTPDTRPLLTSPDVSASRWGHLNSGLGSCLHGAALPRLYWIIRYPPFYSQHSDHSQRRVKVLNFSRLHDPGCFPAPGARGDQSQCSRGCWDHPELRHPRHLTLNILSCSNSA